jgi:His-Xaa-Ser system radical SAM maturase HxsC
MGVRLMLPLYGQASFCKGLDERASAVLRLRSPDSQEPGIDADFYLARTDDDISRLRESGHSRIVAIGERQAEVEWAQQAIVLPSEFDYLGDGDIISFHPRTSRFRTHYRRASRHNSFLVTDRCNHYCLMCSQPPKDVDDRWILKEIRDCIPLIHTDTEYLAFTGGEPLLDWQDLVEVLGRCRDSLPTTAVHVLSNGRAFARSDVVSAWASLQHPNLTVGIPLYAAVDHVHDYVVQAAGAFDETLLGILKLKDQNQRVEIRLVLHAITTPHLVDTCKWFARNLPFVDHIALMGLENTGFAIANDELLWIDPADYSAALTESVDILASAKMNVSIYNLPLCVLDRSVWPYATKSISDWKNSFIEACRPCVEKERCAGFFTTGRPRYSRAIQPFLAGEGSQTSRSMQA